MAAVARRFVTYPREQFIASLLGMTNKKFSHRNVEVLGMENEVPVTDTLRRLGYQTFRVLSQGANYEGPTDLFKLPDSASELEEAANRLYTKVDQHLAAVKSRHFLISPRGTKVDPRRLRKSKLGMDASGALTLNGLQVQRKYPCCCVSAKDQMPFASETIIRALPRYNERQIEFVDEQNLADCFSQIAILNQEEGQEPILTLASLNDPKMRSRIEEYRDIFKTLKP